MRHGSWARAFAASSCSIAGLLTTVAASLYPDVLPARTPRFSLTVTNGIARDTVLHTALVGWPFALVLAVAYVIIAYRSRSGRRPDPRPVVAGAGDRRCSERDA